MVNETGVASPHPNKMASQDAPLVLVTGVSGFIASHITHQLLTEGTVRVRGSVRSLENEAKVQALRDLVPDATFPLELVEAQLENVESWNEAVKGCSFVYHVASPVPLEMPADENVVIKPAVEGTMNVLRACAESLSVKRVVLTSSIDAVVLSEEHHNDAEYVSTERDWSDRENANAYSKSKHLAERAAWDFVHSLEGESKFELAVVNPVVVIGPFVTSTAINAISLQSIALLLNQGYPFLLDISFSFVDVRDVAAAHIAAMEKPEAAGNRHILSAETYWFKQIAEVLSAEFGPQGYKVSNWVLPQAGAWVLKFFSGVIHRFYPAIGKMQKLDNTRMKTVLGISPRDVQQSIIDTGYSLIEYGVVHRKPGYKRPETEQ